MTATWTTSEWVRRHPGPHMRDLDHALCALLAEHGDGSPELVAEMRRRVPGYRAAHEACEAALRAAAPPYGDLLDDALDAQWALVNAETIVALGRVRVPRLPLRARLAAVFGGGDHGRRSATLPA